jgi:hypothetical protein
MKRMLCLLLLFASTAALLPACTHYYVKPGSTTADFAKDKRECERVGDRESRKKGTKPCDETERCLEAKGWRRG